MTLAYLATPYTKQADHDEAYMVAVNLAHELTLTGQTCISPIAHNAAISNHHLDHEAIWRWNEAVMDRCDVLIVVCWPGWQESDGIAREVAYFEKLRRPIYDCDPVTLTLTRRPAHKPPRNRIDGTTIEQIEADRREYMGY